MTGQSPDFVSFAPPTPLPLEFAHFSLWSSPNTSDEAHYAAADLSRPEYTLRVKDMAEGERPRERLIHLGPKALSTAELLSILIGPGQGLPGLSSIEIAHAIIGSLHEGSSGGGIDRLQRITFEELLHISGVGPAKAAGIVAAIELGKRVLHPAPSHKTVVDDPAIAVAALTPYLMWETREHFAVVCLNLRHQLLSTKVLTIGTETETLANPRDIFQVALKGGAARIIVAHNHPSGSLEPSPMDLALTRQLLQSATIIGVPVLDHLILGSGEYRSLRQTTVLWIDEPQGV